MLAALGLSIPFHIGIPHLHARIGAYAMARPIMTWTNSDSGQASGRYCPLAHLMESAGKMAANIIAAP